MDRTIAKPVFPLFCISYPGFTFNLQDLRIEFTSDRSRKKQATIHSSMGSFGRSWWNGPVNFNNVRKLCFLRP